MQETTPDRIVAVVIDELKRGTETRRLVAAAGWPTHGRSAAKITSASTP